jgi:glutaredoxin
MSYIIYTIDDCIYCDKAKKLIESEKKIIINCSEMLKSKIERHEFISNINKKVGYDLIQDIIYFPIIFYGDKFIGGFDDLKLYIIMKDYYIFELDCDF